MTPRIGARLTRLEQMRRPAPADLARETALYGERLWSANGARCYARQVEEEGRLAVVGGGDTVVYVLPGVDLADLR